MLLILIFACLFVILAFTTREAVRYDAREGTVSSSLMFFTVFMLLVTDLAALIVEIFSSVVHK